MNRKTAVLDKIIWHREPQYFPYYAIFGSWSQAVTCGTNSPFFKLFGEVSKETIRKLRFY